MNTKTQVWIAKATKKHSNYYIYTNTVFTASKDKVVICCPVHGDFQQIANTHLQGSGCLLCGFDKTGNKLRSSREDIIVRINDLYPDIDLSEINYINATTPIKFKGSDGVEYSATPSKLLAKGFVGSDIVSNRADKFIKRASEKFNNKYTYSKVTYVDTHTHVKVICPIHGEFSTTPINHITGNGCSKCNFEEYGRNKSELASSSFIDKANRKHNNSYDYSYSLYVSAKEPVTILCNKCGVTFDQSPTNHLSGQGCPRCCDNGYNTSKSGYLYVLKCGNLVKIGITNSVLTKRIRAINKSSRLCFKEVTSFHFENGQIPREVERSTLVKLRSMYANPLDKFDGYTEVFMNADVSEVINIIVKQIEAIPAQQHIKGI